MMFELFRKREKKVAPTLSAEDQRVCDEHEAAFGEWVKRKNFLSRALTVTERAHAQAAYDLATKRYAASIDAHKAMMDRLTAEARAKLERERT